MGGEDEAREWWEGRMNEGVVEGEDERGSGGRRGLTREWWEVRINEGVEDKRGSGGR